MKLNYLVASFKNTSSICSRYFNEDQVFFKVVFFQIGWVLSFISKNIHRVSNASEKYKAEVRVPKWKRLRLILIPFLFTIVDHIVQSPLQSRLIAQAKPFG